MPRHSEDSELDSNPYLGVCLAKRRQANYSRASTFYLRDGCDDRIHRNSTSRSANTLVSATLTQQADMHSELLGFSMTTTRPNTRSRYIAALSDPDIPAATRRYTGTRLHVKPELNQITTARNVCLLRRWPSRPNFSGQCEEVPQPAVHIAHRCGVDRTNIADQTVAGHGARLLCHHERRLRQTEPRTAQEYVVRPPTITRSRRQDYRERVRLLEVKIARHHKRRSSPRLFTSAYWIELCPNDVSTAKFTHQVGRRRASRPMTETHPSTSRLRP